MNITYEQLCQIIGEKEVELIFLRKKVAELELKKKEEAPIDGKGADLEVVS